VTLRARDASPDIVHSINLCADELHVQVKRHRDKRRRRREQRAAAAAQGAGVETVSAEEETADGGVTSAA
jgi:putative sigma-54 modulation protein